MSQLCLSYLAYFTLGSRSHSEFRFDLGICRNLKLGLLQAYSFYSDNKIARGQDEPFKLMLLIYSVIF